MAKITSQPVAPSTERSGSIREIDNGYVVHLTAYGSDTNVDQELAFTSVNKVAAIRKALRVMGAFFNAEVS